MYKTTISWYRDMLGDKLKYDQDIAVHPYTNGKIIVIYPGAEGDIDGYNNKYVTLSEYIVKQDLGAVVRCGNPYVGKWDTSLRKMLTYIYDNAKDICGSSKPELNLMGFSAGAGSIATLAWEYPEIGKILLMAPTDRVGEEEVKRGLSNFTGDVYIVIGDNDQVVFTDTGKRFHDMATSANKKELFIIKDCDHQFKTEKNGRVMSQVPFYAFDPEYKKSFPDFNEGIFLYD